MGLWRRRFGGHGEKLPWEVSAAVLAVVLAADYFVFWLLDANYFRWYLASGPLIQLLVSAFALGIDLDRRPNLISADPSDYLGACVRLIGLSLFERAAEVRPVDPAQREATHRSDLPGPGPFDGVVAVLFSIAFLVLSFAWLVVVAPVQYFGNLVAGAPARLALNNPTRTSIAKKPVAVTASITAGLLFAISYFV